MSTARTDLIGWLDELLKPRSFEDYGPNGLQVPGSETVQTVVTGVSAGLELFERAAAEDADLVLVHHGLLWSGPPRPIDLPAKRRLQALFDHDMSLAAYHLPLDAHLEHGNNALLAQALGAELVGPFAGIGVEARFPAPITADELVRRVSDVTRREPTTVLGGPGEVASLSIVSGAGQGHLLDAIAAGHDAFLTGEASERNFNEAREAGVHFVAAGHYATETLGVQRLGELLAERFGVRHVYVDVPNPI
ncbi:MAG: Nif3-like dinuclear metal center hexameric protein [Solirubrobacteraceae bacterium]